MTTQLIGQQIEHYRIDRLVGTGGMGSVYQAMDLNLARPVALKIMHPQYAAQTEFQRRFRQEAQAIARLNHPSIVNIYQFGRRAGYWYLVMEYVLGLSLGAYIKQLAQCNQVVQLNETLDLVAQVADALGYAHWQGIIHRDVKPDNILVQSLERPWHPAGLPLRAVVTDFGLAKLLEGGMDTQSNIMMGTLPYMSPEQVTGDPLDGRSDLYALGVVLYQLATGQLPFDIKSPTDAVIKHLNEHPPDPHQIHPDFPIEVENIILKTLAKRPEDRYQTGEALAKALRTASKSIANGVPLPAAKNDIVSIVTEVHTRYPEPAQSEPPPIQSDPDATKTEVHSRPIVVEVPDEPLIVVPQPQYEQKTAEFSAKLANARINNGGKCEVVVVNRGRTPIDLTLIPRTPSDLVQFDSWRQQVAVAAGQQERVQLTILPTQRPLIGNATIYPFEIDVSAPGQRKALPGKLAITPYAPTWLLLLFVLLTILFLILSVVAYFFIA